MHDDFFKRETLKIQAQQARALNRIADVLEILAKDKIEEIRVEELLKNEGESKENIK